MADTISCARGSVERSQTIDKQGSVGEFLTFCDDIVDR